MNIFSKQLNFRLKKTMPIQKSFTDLIRNLKISTEECPCRPIISKHFQRLPKTPGYFSEDFSKFSEDDRQVRKSNISNQTALTCGRVAV